MSEVPESVWEIVRRADADNPNDIDAAAAQAEKEIRGLPAFNELLPVFVSKAVTRSSTRRGMRRTGGRRRTAASRRPCPRSSRGCPRPLTVRTPPFSLACAGKS